jgi:hypothetical protein
MAAPRTWKSNGGHFSVEAELIDFQDGKVQLKKADGKVISVPLASLSEGDRDYVRRQHPGTEEEKIPPGAEYRTWKDKSGKFAITAEYLGCSEGKVQLGKTDGTKIRVDLVKLSPGDQRWLKEHHPEEPPEPEENTEKQAEDKQLEELGAQNIDLKLVRLDLPKGLNTNKAPKSLKPAQYYLMLTSPQRFLMQSGGVASPLQANFQKIVNKEPQYVAPVPFRAVARLNGQQYAFVLDVTDTKAMGYNKLYFDLNHNGDLTDDTPITTKDVYAPPKSGDSQSQFPRVDLRLDGQGQSAEYSFLLSVQCHGTGAEQFVAMAMLAAAAVREGYITQHGKKIHLVLVDKNSNGRFDDLTSVHFTGNRIIPSWGDLLLVNPNPKNLPSGEGGLGRDQYFLNRTVFLGRNFYRLEVAPPGDNLKLTPAELALGYITNPSPAYRAVIFSDDYGVVMIGGTKDQKIPLPEGPWKIANYTLAAAPGARFAQTAISAAFSDTSAGITVKKGETMVLPFGVPYRAKVTAERHPQDKDKVLLSLSILGTAGEQCTGISINGAQPPGPQFVIKDSEGKEVHQGKFKFG